MSSSSSSSSVKLINLMFNTTGHGGYATSGGGGHFALPEGSAAFNASSLTQNGSYEHLANAGFEKVLDEFRASLYTYGDPSTVVLLCFYVPIFLLALAGNLMVFLIIVCNRNMRSVTNYFLLNLAIADLLVTIVCIPLTVGEMVYEVWVYGEFLCKASGYVQGVCITASVLTIMALSVDRYVAIRHPVKSRRFSTKTHVKIAIAVIWAMSYGVMVPLYVMRELSETTLLEGAHFTYCHEGWPSPEARRLFDIFLFVFIYVMPGVVITASYSSTGCHLLSSKELLQRQDSDVYQGYKIMAGRRRVARMLLILAILFAVSWMPYHAVSLYMNFSSGMDASNSLMTLSFALMLGHSHSAQNPILYCLTNNSFKRGMLGLLRCQRTHLSDFTRASTKRDPRQDKRRFANERFRQSVRNGTADWEAGTDSCTVAANPMLVTNNTNNPRARRVMYATVSKSTSSDEDCRAQEAVPLMTLKHEEEGVRADNEADHRGENGSAGYVPPTIVNCHVVEMAESEPSAEPLARTQAAGAGEPPARTQSAAGEHAPGEAPSGSGGAPEAPGACVTSPLADSEEDD